MPLLLRTVDPTHVARGTLPDRFPVQNDLEAVSNGTLSNVIRQLSALSHHADELFTDLIGVASGIAHRAGNLQARIDRLAVRVGQIDAVQEESASIQESLNTKPFTSSLVFDQQVVSRASLPPSMLKTFQMCDMPPPLDKLNKYRDDGRNGLQFYTDPSYFFDLWRQEMLKDTERAMDRGKKPHKLKQDGQGRHKKRVRQPHNTRERQRQLALQHGEHLIGSTSPDFRNQTQTNSMESHDGNGLAYPSPPDPRASYAVGRGPSMESDEASLQNRASLQHQQQQQQRQQYEAYQRYYASQNQNYESPGYASRNNRNTPVNGYRPSQPPPAPPPNFNMNTPPQGPTPMQTPPSGGMNNMSSRMSASRSNHRETLPPPPPPPTEINNISMFPHPQPEDEDLPPPPPTPLEHGMLRAPSLPEEHLPPSPPPPPLDDTPSQAPPPPPPPPPGIPVMAQNGDAGPKSSTPKPKKNVVVVERDGRDELLRAIRDGINLRKVETNGVKVEEKPSTYHDVASILARRVAVEMSDSDSGSSEYDSDGWDEASA